MIELLNEWLIRVLKETNQPSKEIKAFNFGLFESEQGNQIYFIGSKLYDPNDDDWACDDDYTPSERYFLTPDPVNKLGFEEFQDYVIKALKEVLQRDIYENSFLGKDTIITVGFDDGDLVRIN